MSPRRLIAQPICDTAHRIELDGSKLNALCAIDALGVGGMFRSDVTIESSCRACEAKIEIATADDGKSLNSARPADAVVWYDLAFSRSAATSCCPSIAFFCRDDISNSGWPDKSRDVRVID